MNAYDVPSRALAATLNRRPGYVWTAHDFPPFGSRVHAGRMLRKLSRDGKLRKVARGMYDAPNINPLTKKTSSPNYQEVVRAMMRRSVKALLIDEMIAANYMGWTDAVPARIVYYRHGRSTSIVIGKQVVEFKRASKRRVPPVARLHLFSPRFLLNNVCPTCKMVGRHQVSTQL